MTDHHQIIGEIAGVVEAACASENNQFGYSIWTHHITRVVSWGKALAPVFEADVEIVELAALLHDYASVKDPAFYKDHHIHSAAEAGHLLGKFEYPEEKIQAVQHCITSHRGSVPAVRETPEAECLANADALVHLETVPALLHLVYVERGMGLDEGAAWVRAKLNRTWRKLSPPIQEQARVKYEAAILTLETANGQDDA